MMETDQRRDLFESVKMFVRFRFNSAVKDAGAGLKHCLLDVHRRTRVLNQEFFERYHDSPPSQVTPSP